MCNQHNRIGDEIIHMGRPKGSKNKATLAKELGMSLEEYNQKYKDNTSSLKSTDNTKTISKGAEHPNITSNTRFLLPTTSPIEENNITGSKEPVLIPKSKTPSKGHIYCNRCHKEILKDSVKIIDFSKLLGIGEYHFKTENKVNLCYDCLLGLGKVIDEYLYNEGKGNKLKIEVEENGEER